jgi:uncharacterized protein (DUF1697 family)
MSLVTSAMASVVFLRAVNVGGANLCKPAELARQLSRFDIVNIGAVGTFVVHKKASESTLRNAIAKKLPFKCEIMIAPALTIVDLARKNPLRGETGDEIDAHVSILAKAPATIPKLPFCVPMTGIWEIKIVDVIGSAAISLRRRLKNGRRYPNEVVEKQFAVAATTRSWNTIEKVVKILTKD